MIPIVMRKAGLLAMLVGLLLGWSLYSAVPASAADLS